MYKYSQKMGSSMNHDSNRIENSWAQPQSNQHCQLSQDTCDHHPFFALVCLTNPGIHGSKFITISRALRAPCWEEVQATHHLRSHKFEQCARPQTLSLSIVRWHETYGLPVLNLYTGCPMSPMYYCICLLHDLNTFFYSQYVNVMSDNVLASII